MIDIHTHILPGVDDGSRDIEESVDMLRMAESSGVRCLAATPHCNIPGMFDNYISEELTEQFLALKRVAERLKISTTVFSGMEVFATPDLPWLLKNERVFTLNGTRYFLTEFSFDEEPEFCDHILGKCRELQYQPIIAHPERYDFVQDNPRIAERWAVQGYVLQLNKGSILGRFGRIAKQTADTLIRKNLVSCVASDAHSSERRTPHMQEIKEYLKEAYGTEYARMVLLENPQRILTGKEVQPGQASFGEEKEF